MSDENKLEAPEADEYMDEDYGTGETHSDFGEEYEDSDKDTINQNQGGDDPDEEPELELEPENVAPAKDKKNKLFNMIIAGVSLIAVIMVGVFAYVAYTNNVAKKERARQEQAQVNKERESQQKTTPVEKERRPQADIKPMVEMPLEQQATPVSTPNATVVATGAKTPFADASSEVSDLVETHERKITKIAEVMVQAGSEIKDLKEQLATANERIAAMESQLKANEKKIASNKKAASNKKTTSSRGSAGVAVAKQQVLKAYRVESMFDNKAWITYKGTRHIVTIGDNIPGAGKVITINLNAQNVTTTRGIIQ